VKRVRFTGDLFLEEIFGAHPMLRCARIRDFDRAMRKPVARRFSGTFRQIRVRNFPWGPVGSVSTKDERGSRKARMHLGRKDHEEWGGATTGGPENQGAAQKSTPPERVGIKREPRKS
jgi:hypothetical protein